MMSMMTVLMAIEAIEDDNEREYIGNLFEKESPYVMNIARSILHNETDAEDAVIETFLRVIRYREHFLWRTRDEIIGLLVKCTRCACIDMQRKQSRRNHIPLEQDADECTSGISIDDIADEIDVLQELVRDETIDEVRKALEELGSPDKEIMELRFYYELRTDVIAGLVGMNASTVRTKIQRTKEKMRERLERYYHGQN